MTKEKEHKEKQRSTKHTHKIKDRVTRTPLKTGSEVMCSGRVSTTYFSACLTKTCFCQNRIYFKVIFLQKVVLHERYKKFWIKRSLSSTFCKLAPYIWQKSNLTAVFSILMDYIEKNKNKTTKYTPRTCFYRNIYLP